MSSANWPLWRRQVATLVRQEVGRSLFSRRSLAAYVLASMPIAVAVLRMIFLSESQRANPAFSTSEFAATYSFFILRFVVFFGCAHLFVKLFRGEMLERSLHYSLLAPLRREVLVLGKYLGGVTSTVAVFVPTVVATFVLYYVPHGTDGLLRTVDVGHLVSYAAATVLACVAYGAVFLLAGLFFRNPMLPAVILLGWEMLTPFLPALLKRVSVVHYLASLRPVPLTEGGPFALLAQPVAPWLAVLALIAGPLVMLLIATWKTRRLEISYSTDE